MRSDSNTYRKLAPLLSFIVPGAGHLALGLHLKGLLLLTGALTDIMAMIRFADDSGGKFALLIVFLGLALPMFWFYSVFDTLQQSARQRYAAAGAQEPAQSRAAVWTQSIVLIVAALLLLALVRSPSVLTPWIDAVGTYGPEAILVAIAVLLLTTRRGKSLLKTGRATAAIVIIVVGGLLLWDQIRGRNDIELLGQWWPAAFVLLGIEVVVGSLAARSRKRPGFDIGGSLLAVVVAVTAFAITQYSTMPFSWLDNFKVNITNMEGFGEEKGFKYELDAVAVPVSPGLASLSIKNVNGDITVKKGDVSELTVAAVMWVDTTDKQEADGVRNDSTVEASGDEKLKIETKGKPYGEGGSRKPRIDIVVTVPATSTLGQLPLLSEADLPYEINETSGDDDSSSIIGGSAAVAPEEPADEAANSTAGESEDGPIVSTDAESPPPGEKAMTEPGADSGEGALPVMLQKTPGGETPASAGEALLSGEALLDAGDAGNGSEQNHENSGIDAVKAEMSIEASNGNIRVDGLVVQGGLKIRLTDGEIHVGALTGPLDAQTKNGSIDAADIDGSVQLQASNGDVKAARIAGDIDGSTQSGNIALEHISGHTEVETKNGGIDIREVEGSVKADTLNGDIVIRSAVVGGNWDIDSSIGEIGLYVPETGDYSVNGSVTFGTVSTDLPLAATKKTISGDIGLSTYRINIDANSSISVNRYQP